MHVLFHLPAVNMCLLLCLYYQIKMNGELSSCLSRLVLITFLQLLIISMIYALGVWLLYTVFNIRIAC